MTWKLFIAQRSVFDPVRPALTYLMPLKGEEYLYSSDKYSDISER